LLPGLTGYEVRRGADEEADLRGGRRFGPQRRVAGIEARGQEFQKRVRNAFLDIALEESQRFIVLNANQTREKLHQEIVAVLRLRGLDLK